VQRHEAAAGAHLVRHRVRDVGGRERIEDGPDAGGDPPRRDGRPRRVDRDGPAGLGQRLGLVLDVDPDDPVVRVGQLTVAAVLPDHAGEQPDPAGAEPVLVGAQRTGALGEEGQVQRVAPVGDDRLEHRAAA
jgi:hypothetical protein